MITSTATSDRVERLRAQLDEAQLDALLVSNASNRRYLSGFTGSAGSLIISRDEVVLATDFRYWEQSGGQSPAFRLYKTVGKLEEWFAGLIEGLGGKRLGFESADLSYAMHRQMLTIVEELPPERRPQLVPTVALIEKLRAVKDADEVDQLQAAINAGDAAIEDVIARLDPSWTEKQVAWEIERHLREHGADGPSFRPIVASGAWGAMPHAYPRDELLQEGAGVVMDMGALVDGYCSDLTRTVHLGAPQQRFDAIYDIVLAAQLAASEMIEPGMTGQQAHMLAQSVIDAAGYGENFGHGLGHGIGLQVHEFPLLSKSSTDVLAEGMVFSIEPGVYIPGWGGIRIEDLAVLENGRCRFLSHAAKLR
jgi:Xaa-Pro aminopeptidase